MQKIALRFTSDRSGCGLHSWLQPSNFLDYNLGYHQIPLKVEDQIKTSFITPFGAFFYKSKPFRLKSVGETYQWCIQRCLHSQTGHNAEAYIDDMVIRTRENRDSSLTWQRPSTT
jgi:hypothetical protein